MASHHPQQALNVILIVLDAMRAANLSLYGYPLRTSPFLEEFAGQNLLFKRAISPATWTIPSHASLLSGLYQAQHRLESVKANRRFSDNIQTLPALLRDSGYHTVAFSQNFLFGEDYHLADGFSEFHQLEDYLNLPRRGIGQSRGPAKLLGANGPIRGYLRKMKGARRLLDEMNGWLQRKQPARPVFMMANLTGTHYPWAPAPNILLRALGTDIRMLLNREYITLEPFKVNSGLRTVTETHRRIWLALYNAAIKHMDSELARFLHRLPSWEGWSNSIVIITADHGELLGDYRNIVGHTLCLSDKLIHVPLIVRHPDYDGGKVVERVVQTHDIYASLVHWLELDPEAVDPAQLQRPPLATALDNAGDNGGIAFAEEDFSDTHDVIAGLRRVNPNMDAKKYPRQQIAVRSATHKYLWYDDRPAELFDLESDPEELQDVSGSTEPAYLTALQMLQSALESWRSNLKVFRPALAVSGATLSEDVTAHLRHLGYVD